MNCINLSDFYKEKRMYQEKKINHPSKSQTFALLFIDLCYYRHLQKECMKYFFINGCIFRSVPLNV